MTLSTYLCTISWKAYSRVFRSRNTVCPQSAYNKWYKDTPVQVLGAPSMEAEMKEMPSLILERKIEVDT